MKYARQWISALIAMCGIFFAAACSRQEPIITKPAANWELQPSVAKAYYENNYWQIDVSVLINSETVPRHAASSLAGRLKGGVYGNRTGRRG
jgi:hypothetical protein